MESGKDARKGLSFRGYVKAEILAGAGVATVLGVDHQSAEFECMRKKYG